MFQRILVPLDGSEIAEQALSIAARIARGSGGSVLLLRVLDILPTLWPGHMKAFIEASAQEVEKYLIRLTEAPMFDGITTETQVVFGSASSTILSIADTSHVDSIVLSSRGHTGITRWILGSVAEFVILHATVPVFLLREEDMALAESNSATPRPLCALVPLDTAEPTKDALVPAASLIATLVAPSKGQLRLTHVVKPAKAGKEELQKNALREAEKFLRAAADSLPQELAQSPRTHLRPTVTWTVTVHENAAEGITSEAWRRESEQEDGLSGGGDVIVMKTNQISKGRWTFGSTTERVLSRTQLPLLIIPPFDKADTRSTPSEQMEAVSTQGRAHKQQPAPEQGGTTKQRTFPLTRPGAIYPKDYVIAVIDDVAEAEDVVQSLQKVGIAAEDIRLFESREVLENAEQTSKNRSFFERIADVFQTTQGEHVLIYVHEAGRGHNIINVHAPTSEQIELVREILVSHHARNIKHFGNWTISILHH